MNSIGLHVCCVGDYDVYPPTLEMLRVLIKRVLHPWMDRYGIEPKNVIGHREAGLMDGFDYRKTNFDGTRQYKTCPGLAWDMDALRGMLD